MPTPNGNPGQLLQDLDTLRQALASDLEGVPTGSRSQAFLVVLCGLPGSGKSHIARELVRRVPMAVLSSDRLRKALAGQPKYTALESSRLFAACHQLIEELLREGRKVLFDATNLNEGFRQPLYDITGSLDVPLILAHLTAPNEVIRQRLAGRANGESDSSFSDADWRIYCRLRPMQQPIARPHYAVDTSQDITPVVEEIAQRVQAGSKGKSTSTLEVAPEV
ncbi:MAG: ATP-binding protein [Dehalococcoidia bacterium]|nr:ATP-binding protein [Dehalococcoidia bacterium]MSQ16909.1 ATP-binding protein [Dehalococcoidia bacterium]